MKRIAWVAFVIGCGGAAATSAPPASVVRVDLVCTEAQPTGEFECVARGCQWGPPLFCSGIRSEDDGYARDATRPCVCTCEADMIECMSRP